MNIQIIQNKLLDSKFRLAWNIISTFIVLFIFFFSFDIQRGVDMRSTNDEWEHQSLAVNYAKGYGLFKLGNFAGFDQYKIDNVDATFPFLYKLFSKYPTSYFHRACGASIIHGTIYKLFGVFPLFIRLFNILLLIASWYFIVLAHRIGSNQINVNRILQCLFPFFILINYSYVQVIGDDCLMIFALSAIFFSSINWWNKNNLRTSILLILSLIFSLFIKSTLFFLPLFILGFAIWKKRWKHVITAASISLILIFTVFSYSKYLNKIHHQSIYPNKQIFHSDMLQTHWSALDSLTMKQHKLEFVDDVNFGFNDYKQLATYLFERQFYTQRFFLLSGQSWFLLIDGNNETCISFRNKHEGSWNAAWKLYPKSFYYHYDDESSAVENVIMFYVNKFYLIPFLFYAKWYATYHWSILFMCISIVLMYLFVKEKLNVTKPKTKFIAIVFLLIFYVTINSVFLTPFLMFFVIYLLYIYNTLFKEEFYQIVFLFSFYFLFLSTLMFGLERYTGIANGMYLLILMNILVTRGKSSII